MWTDLCCYASTGVTICLPTGNGLAVGAGAAAGPLHPAADRPFSQPPGPPPEAASSRPAGCEEPWPQPCRLA
jgi:hypothetical protein